MYMPVSASDEQEAHRSQVLRLRGFDPNVEEFEAFNFFTLEEAKSSVFGSTRSNPVPVTIGPGSDGGGKIAVVIDMVKPSYNPDLIGPSEDYPDWYFEGWVMPSGFTPNTKFKRIRMWVSTLGENEFIEGDFLHWQWIEETAAATLPIDASILKLNPSGRARTLLGSQGLQTIGDVLEFAKRHDFCEISGFGPGLLANLKTKLSEAGYDVSNFTFRH